ncbi:hypothetical protein V8C37DRAFT_371270 [Trichoderma ceciliae]
MAFVLILIWPIGRVVSERLSTTHPIATNMNARSRLLSPSRCICLWVILQVRADCYTRALSSLNAQKCQIYDIPICI